MVKKGRNMPPRGGLAGACGLHAACWRDGGWGRSALAVALAVVNPWILVLVGVLASKASGVISLWCIDWADGVLRLGERAGF